MIWKSPSECVLLWIVKCTILYFIALTNFGPVLWREDCVFAVLKIVNSVAIKLEVFSLGRDVLSSIDQGIHPYTSAKFRAFNTILNNVAPFSYAKME